MELLIGVVVIAAILLFLRSKKTEGSQTNSLPDPAPIRRTRTGPSQVHGTQTSRFDPSSARHLLEERILTGAAYVVDGDTIRIQKTQVRLFGVDAPELDHPYGVRAKRALQRLCKGHVIRAEVTDLDSYGRTLAHCYLPDGRDLSAEMVKLGLAIDWPKFSGGKYGSLEVPEVRKKLFLADARQKGRMHVWENFEKRKSKQ
ncbi:thermonuclease family protein [Defluviimonas sp. WL0002]|uniref:Thermonuclease family protein n=1 Tax=Albidovulum marisflavi TaxID=2984159 RepID=A0ABT2ZDZ5_9RHOB|nr:thermonuclease family protein [Defluviimonas sp. WL0002]MCV2869268.1 thermonuclease family protein [Defluviimonas sp. WL0002]